MRIIGPILILSLFISTFVLGWFGNDIYRDYKNKRDIDGLFIKDKDYKEASNIANNRDNGDWVCVNVRGMEYSRAVEVCKHEVGHEIFAEICEKDIDKCLGVIQ